MKKIIVGIVGALGIGGVAAAITAVIRRKKTTSKIQEIQ